MTGPSGSSAREVDPRIWNIDPDALGGPPSGPVSLSSPALEHLLIQVGRLSAPFGRRLSSEERTMLGSVFGESVDLSRIRVIEARIANAPTTLGNQIRVRPGMSLASDQGKSILVHETAHVWQYQTQGTRYISCSIYHQIEGAVRTGTRRAAYYNYQFNARRSISDYPAEQQAQIIQDYYQLTVRYANSTNPPEWVVQRREDLPHYERLIRQVRSYQPRSQTQIYTDSLMTDPADRLGLPRSLSSPGTLPLVPLIEFRFNTPW